MKRLIFIIAVVFATTSLAAQSNVKVTTNDGVTTSGYFVEGTDSIYTIRHQVDKGGKYGFDTLSFHMQDIYEVKMYGKVFVPVNGKLVLKKSLQNDKTTNYASVDTYRAKPSNPNLVIGKALKSTGSTAIGVGVPCLVAGAVMWHFGLQNTVGDMTSNPMNLTVDKAMSGSRLASAGICLAAIGGTLTVVGIPLHIHGKKIMTMNVNYTGNGAGVALQF